MRTFRFLLILAFAALVAAGCGDDAGADSPAPIQAAPPTTTPTATTSSTTAPVATTSAPAFPVEVMADLGEVTISARPERVVSLSATHTEIIYALGVEDQLVATDLFSNYPPEAEEKAKIDAFSFNVEEVAALDPDLVILGFDFQGETAALATIDIPFLLLGPPSDLKGMYEQFRVMGAALGVPETGEELAAGAEERVAAMVSEAIEIANVTFFHEVDNTYYTTTSASFLGDVYSSLGLINIADSASAEGPFPQLAAEFILDQDPDFIFLGDAAFGESAETVANRPGWDVLSAVTGDRIVEIDADISGRWGPRTVDLMRSIFEAVIATQQ